MAIVRVDVLLDSFGGQKQKEDTMLTVRRIEELLVVGSVSDLAQRIHTALENGATQSEFQDWLEATNVVPLDDTDLSDAIFAEMATPPSVPLPPPSPRVVRPFFPTWAAVVMAVLLVAVVAMAIQLYFTNSWVESDSRELDRLERRVDGITKVGDEFLAAAATWAHPEELKCGNVAAQSVDDCLMEKSLPCVMVCCNQWAQSHPQYMGAACRKYISPRLGPPAPYPPPAPPKS